MGGDGMIMFLAHVHIFDATPVCLSCYGDHGGVGWGWGGDDNVPCTCTHLRCYACVSVLLWRSWWGGVGMGRG